MAVKMQALNRFHYPSGSLGRDYNAGDTFDALSDRDVKALTLLRRAKVVDNKLSVEPYKPPRKPVVEEEHKSEEKSEPKSEQSERKSKPAPVKPMSTMDFPADEVEVKPPRRKFED